MEYSLDLNALESAYKNGARVHLLCNPHNPVGILYSKETLEAIAELAHRYNVTVISDEIHAPLTFSGNTFTPFLAVSDTSREVGITVTSASKAFNLAGLKCALIITGGGRLKDQINSMPISVAFRASLFGAVAATAALSQARPWLDEVIKALDHNRTLLKQLIETQIPAISYRVPDFGYLAWLDLSALGLGDNPADLILERGKVAINGGAMYGKQYPQFARLNFGTSPEIITEGIHRILRSLT